MIFALTKVRISSKAIRTYVSANIQFHLRTATAAAWTRSYKVTHCLIYVRILYGAL